MRNTFFGLLAVGRPDRDPDGVRTARGLLAAAACAISLLAAAGCEPVIDTPAGAAPQQPGGAQAPNQDPPPQGVATALTQLDGLTVAEWATMSGYKRDRFPHWDSQGNSCDTRDVVLQRDGSGVVTADDCKIVDGTWYSVYDGASTTDPQEIDIDHMVPLANAWRTGAKTWTDEQRGAFANDLERPQLFAVTASSNRSKGDQDPSQWKPPRQAYWCVYAQNWIAVKTYWRLSVTIKEKAALEDMLETC